MKKLIFSALAAILSFVFICACTSPTEPVNGDPDVIEEIKTAYYNANKAHFVSEYYSYTENDITIRYYGEYDGAHVMFVDVPYMAYDCAVWEVTVGGVTINYNDGQRLQVYREGSFCSMEAAFENGYLKHGDLIKIRDLHRKDFAFVY